MELVDAMFNEAAAETGSLISFCGIIARRGSENGEDVDQMPPALRLSAPGKIEIVVHVVIIVSTLVSSQGRCSTYRRKNGTAG